MDLRGAALKKRKADVNFISVDEGGDLYVNDANVYVDGTRKSVVTDLFGVITNGTWTPELLNIDGDFAVTYTDQEGTWARSGNMIFATFYLSFTVTANTTGSNVVQIGAVPVSTPATGKYPVHFSSYKGLDLDSGDAVQGLLDGGSTFFTFHVTAAAADTTETSVTYAPGFLPPSRAVVLAGSFTYIV